MRSFEYERARVRADVAGTTVAPPLSSTTNLQQFHPACATGDSRQPHVHHRRVAAAGAPRPGGPVYSQRLARTSQPVSGGLTVTAVCYTRGLSLVPAQRVQPPHCNPGGTAAAAAAAACDLSFSS